VLLRDDERKLQGNASGAAQIKATVDSVEGKEETRMTP